MRQLALILPLCFAVGCTASVPIGASTDARVDTSDAQAPVSCGAGTCAPGLVCCNTSCGTCAAFGTCPSITTVCPPDAGAGCGADLVSLSGSRVCSSFVWNGTDCVQVLGCTCTGDCTVPQPTYAACMSLHHACWPSGCTATIFCPNDFFCEHGSCADTAGTCTAVPTDCASFVAVPTCGCNGLGYRSPCDAQSAAQTILPTPTCGVCNLPALTLAPGCATSLGWAWNGAHCVEQLGCSCSGECDRMEATEAACNARYQSTCAPYFPCGAASCARNTELCELGTGCRPIPASCAPAACSCLTLAAGEVCSDDHAGGLVVTPP